MGDDNVPVSTLEYISTATAPEETYGRITSEVRKLVDCDSATIFLFDSSTNALVTSSATAESESRGNSAHDIAQKTVTAGKLLTVNASACNSGSVDNSSTVSAPINDANGVTIGVLQAKRSAGGTFNFADVCLVLKLSVLAGLTMPNNAVQMRASIHRGFAAAQQLEIVGQAAGVYIQIDQFPTRIVPVFGSTASHAPSDKVCSRGSDGVVSFDKKGLHWRPATGRESNLKQPGPAGMRIMYDEITRIMGHTCQTFGVQSTSNSNADGSLDIEQQSNICQSAWYFYRHTTRDDDIYYLRLHLKSGVAVKMYPFSLTEINSVLSFLQQHATSCVSLSEFEFVEIELERRHAQLQAEVFEQLEAQDDFPWVATTEDLQAVLKNLLSDTKPVSMYDMERLFHSCRLFAGVSIETLAQLKRRWANSCAEAAQHRILSVLERLVKHHAIAVAPRDRGELQRWLQPASNSSSVVKMRIHALIRAVKASCRKLNALNTGRLRTAFDNIPGFELRGALASSGLSTSNSSAEHPFLLHKWRHAVHGIRAANIFRNVGMPSSVKRVSKTWRRSVHKVQTVNAFSSHVRSKTRPVPSVSSDGMCASETWRRSVHKVQTVNAFSSRIRSRTRPVPPSPSDGMRASKTWRRSVQKVQTVNAFSSRIRSRLATVSE
eukprot:COSAG01_NODE_1682_length_9500_cov_7.543666_8_plen_662_part_00